MKKLVFSLIIISGILILSFSCKNGKVKEAVTEAVEFTDGVSGQILVAKDIITEVIVKPDSLSDPWEIEKVKNYNGRQMFIKLFENISTKKVTVYNNLTGAPLSTDDVRKMQSEIGPDLSRIAKIQFLEDWYFNFSTNKIIKKIKSASFGYMTGIGEAGPVRYKALFKLKIDE
jgi:hypothetical protein